MSKNDTIDKRRLTWLCFPHDNKPTAKRKAKLLRFIVDNPDTALSAKKMQEVCEVSHATIYRYLQDGNFRERLESLATHLSAKALTAITEIAEEGGHDTRLKANLELFKAFSAKAQGQSGVITMDGGERRQRVANEATTGPRTVNDLLQLLESDHFGDYAKRLRTIKESEPAEIVNDEAMERTTNDDRSTT